jgi:glutamine cyclotransferase
LNGIAWDASNKILYITGKNWNRIFKVKIEDY